jgi:hypothetical protein
MSEPLGNARVSRRFDIATPGTNNYIEGQVTVAGKTIVTQDSTRRLGRIETQLFDAGR